MIHETVVTTCSAAGAVHVAPMGVRYERGHVVLRPFRPSTTLDNIEATGYAVLNIVTDVRVFAGCVTGRRDWPTVAVPVPPDGVGRPDVADGLGDATDPARAVEARTACVRLACALSHVVLRLVERDDDAQRPTLRLARWHAAHHAPFEGFNRAQAAVIEGAVLVSRLHLLPAGKVDDELRYLQIAVDRTAGPAESQAWDWLLQAVAKHRAGAAGTRPGAGAGAASLPESGPSS